MPNLLYKTVAPTETCLTSGPMAAMSPVVKKNERDVVSQTFRVRAKGWRKGGVRAERQTTRATQTLRPVVRARAPVVRKRTRPTLASSTARDEIRTARRFSLRRFGEHDAPFRHRLRRGHLHQDPGAAGRHLRVLRRHFERRPRARRRRRRRPAASAARRRRRHSRRRHARSHRHRHHRVYPSSRCVDGTHPSIHPCIQSKPSKPVSSVMPNVATT